MRLSVTLGKALNAIGQGVDVAASGIAIVGDWIALGKEISDAEIRLIQEEIRVDIQIRQQELAQRIEKRLKEAGIQSLESKD